jgi:tRNA A37 threonylcarbamoyladenosine biosynthesis protein TsaE
MQLPVLFAQDSGAGKTDFTRTAILSEKKRLRRRLVS